MISLLEGFRRSTFSCACVIGQYVDDDDIVLFVSCPFYLVVCLLQFVSCVFLNVVFCCLFFCFFVYEVKCVLYVVCVEKFVVSV